MNYLREYAEQLYKNGYRIIPIRKGKKHPGTKGWESFVSTSGAIKRWWKNDSYTGVGFLSEYTIGVDIDIKDDEVVQKLISKLKEQYPDHPFIMRVGEAPKILIPFRIEDEESKFHKIQSAVYLDWLGTEHKLEILGKGNQFVGYHIHPDTKKPYEYLSDSDFLNTKYKDLPTMNAVQAKSFVDFFEQELIPELEWEKKPSKSSSYKNKDKPVASDDPLDNIVDPLDVTDLKVVMTLEAIDADCDYDVWYKTGMALWHQYRGNDLGFSLYKTWSRSSANPKHSGNVSKEKWNSFQEDINDTRPVTFAYCLDLASDNTDYDEIEDLRALLPVVLEDDEEEDETEEDNIGEVVKPKLGTRERKKLDSFTARYVYVGHGKKVMDKLMPVSFKLFELEDFHQYFAEEMIKVVKPLKGDPLNVIWKPVSKLWSLSRDRQKVLDIKYAPGQKRFFRDDTNSKYANIFHFPDHKKNAKKLKVKYEGTDRIGIFLDHIDYLIPCEKERKWFLQWVAYVIQQPEERCPIMPIHVSKNLQGTGRSWTLRVLQMLVGEWNVNTPDVEDLIGENGNFNDHLVDCKIIACEELRIDGRDKYKVENALKSDVTDYTKYIRRKYGGQSTERLYGCFLAFTNYGDAIPISSDDRRYNVFSGPGFKNTPEHYRKLLAWIDQKNTGIDEVNANIAQLFNYFENLDISDFDLSAPMDTPARRTMMMMSKSDVEEMYDNFVSTTDYRVLTDSDVRNEIINIEGLGYDTDVVAMNKVTAVMRQKATSIGRVRAGGKQHRVWSLDNVTYSNKEAGTMYQKYLDAKDREDYES